MYRTRRACVVALWITLAWTSVLARREITSCLEVVSEVPLSCDTNYLIFVTRAFLGRTRDKSIEMFCSSPHSSTDDCRSNEAEITADLGRSVSTFTTGRYTMPNSKSVQCGIDYDGYSYIHIEYECLPRRHPTTKLTIPFADMLREDRVDGSMVYMMSRGYGQWNGNSHSSCRVDLSQGTALSVTIYDFISNTSNTECSARLLVTAETTSSIECAATSWKRKTLNYTATAGKQRVEFLLQHRYPTIASRLWVLLNATGVLSVLCGENVVTLPPTTTSVSTTTVTITETTALSAQSNTDNLTMTTPSATTSTRNQRTSSVVPKMISTVEEASTVDNIVYFLEDNIIAFATAGAIVFLLVVIVCIMCVVSKKRRKPKTDEHEVIDGWQWQSQPPPASDFQPTGSNASTLKHDTIDPYAASGETRSTTGQSCPSPTPNKADLYAVPVKKKKPIYTNIEEPNNSDHVYGYAREISQ